MDHLKILGMKFIAISISVLSIFGIFNYAGINNLIVISLLTTGISYLLGDMIILRMFGIVTASIADFGLAFLSYWMLGNLFIAGDGQILLASLAAAFFTTCVEVFIHAYILDQYTDDDYLPMDRLQTEFAEEMNVETSRAKQDHQSGQDQDRDS